MAIHAEAPANAGPHSFGIRPPPLSPVTSSFRSRRILHCNVTQHPTAEWTTQQCRELLVFDHPYRYVIHDRDAIFSPGLDTTLKGFGIRVLKTPVRAPKANAFCERLIGTIRRECLDFLIPLGRRSFEEDSS